MLVGDSTAIAGTNRSRTARLICDESPHTTHDPNADSILGGAGAANWDPPDTSLKPDVALRIVVVRPPAGVHFGLQHGLIDVNPILLSNGEDLAFSCWVRAGGPTDAAPRFFGAYAHGPPNKQFLYVNSGACAGQMDSQWTRRAKVPLTQISQRLIRALLDTPGAVLEACIDGKAKDGGPACAKTPLLGNGWMVVRGTRLSTEQPCY